MSRDNGRVGALPGDDLVRSLRRRIREVIPGVAAATEGRLSRIEAWLSEHQAFSPLWLSSALRDPHVPVAAPVVPDPDEFERLWQHWKPPQWLHDALAPNTWADGSHAPNVKQLLREVQKTCFAVWPFIPAKLRPENVFEWINEITRSVCCRYRLKPDRNPRNGGLPGLDSAWERALGYVSRMAGTLAHMERHAAMTSDVATQTYCIALGKWHTFDMRSEKETDGWFWSIYYHCIGYTRAERVVQPIDEAVALAGNGVTAYTTGTRKGDRAVMRERVGVLHEMFPVDVRGRDLGPLLGDLPSFWLLLVADTLECVLQETELLRRTWCVWVLLGLPEPEGIETLRIDAKNYAVRRNRIQEKGRQLLAMWWAVA